MIARCEYENKEKCKWKWKIYSGKEKKCANESSESRTKRLATQSQYQRQKIANELAECREERLFNQHQYQKENTKNGSADHIRQERLASQHLYQNEKNAYSATITDEISCYCPEYILLSINQLWYKHRAITPENLRLSNPTVEKYLMC